MSSQNPDRRTDSLVTFHSPLVTVLLERETGIEPATNSLEGCDSTTELLPRPLFDFRFSISDSASYARPSRWTASTVVNPKSKIQNHKSTRGGQGRIRTPVARKERQVYSLLPLTARPPVQFSFDSGASSRRR